MWDSTLSVVRGGVDLPLVVHAAEVEVGRGVVGVALHFHGAVDGGLATLHHQRVQLNGGGDAV